MVTSNFSCLIKFSAVIAFVSKRDNISFVAIFPTRHKLAKLKLILPTPITNQRVNHMYHKLHATCVRSWYH